MYACNCTKKLLHTDFIHKHTVQFTATCVVHSPIIWCARTLTFIKRLHFVIKWLINNDKSQFVVGAARYCQFHVENMQLNAASNHSLALDVVTTNRRRLGSTGRHLCSWAVGRLTSSFGAVSIALTIMWTLHWRNGAGQQQHGCMSAWRHACRQHKSACALWSNIV